MKNTTKFRLKRVVTTPAVQGDPTRQLPDQPEKTTLILSPEDFDSHQAKLQIAVDKVGDYQKGDIFEVTVTRTSKVKKAKTPKEGKEDKEGGKEGKESADDGNELPTSEGIHATDAIEKIGTMEDPDEIKAYVKGEDRSTITDAAKARIKELKHPEKDEEQK